MAYKVSTLLKLHNESERQFKLWGKQDLSPQQWMSILGEEFGESCKDVNDFNFDNYQTELIQVAAVALTALENIQEQLCQQTPTAATP